MHPAHSFIIKAGQSQFAPPSGQVDFTDKSSLELPTTSTECVLLLTDSWLKKSVRDSDVTMKRFLQTDHFFERASGLSDPHSTSPRQSSTFVLTNNIFSS